MEGGYKLWDELLKTIGTLTSWPLVVLYLSLLFRQAIARQIPLFFKSLEELIERLAKVKYKGIKAEFDLDKLRNVAAEHSPELAQELLIKLQPHPARHGSSKKSYRRFQVQIINGDLWTDWQSSPG